MAGKDKLDLMRGGEWNRSQDSPHQELQHLLCTEEPWKPVSASKDILCYPSPSNIFVKNTRVPQARVASEVSPVNAWQMDHLAGPIPEPSSIGDWSLHYLGRGSAPKPQLQTYMASGALFKESWNSVSANLELLTTYGSGERESKDINITPTSELAQPVIWGAPHSEKSHSIAFFPFILLCTEKG